MKISFCITCYYRDVHLLQDRIEEIATGQTVLPDEIVVIASGMPDGSMRCLDPRIKIYTFPERMLPGGARNKGGELFSGDVVCFCDVDDPIHPQKCEIVKKIFSENPNVDALVHNFNFDEGDLDEIYDTSNIEIERILEVDPRWENEQKHIFEPHKDIPRTCVIAPSKKPIHHGHLSGRAEMFKTLKYREDMWLGEDGDFCQSIVKSDYNLYYTPLILINYITTKDK